MGKGPKQRAPGMRPMTAKSLIRVFGQTPGSLDERNQLTMRTSNLVADEACAQCLQISSARVKQLSPPTALWTPLRSPAATKTLTAPASPAFSRSSPSTAPRSRTCASRMRQGGIGSTPFPVCCQVGVNSWCFLCVTA